jgi:hypothetical protein
MEFNSAFKGLILPQRGIVTVQSLGIRHGTVGWVIPEVAKGNKPYKNCQRSKMCREGFALTCIITCSFFLCLVTQQNGSSADPLHWNTIQSKTFCWRETEPKENFIQGDHKVFPWLQTFITRKLRGIQTYIFLRVTQLKKFFLQHISTLQHVLLLYSTQFSCNKSL